MRTPLPPPSRVRDLWPYRVLTTLMLKYAVFSYLRYSLLLQLEFLSCRSW
jgi:hypothetical protein